MRDTPHPARVPLWLSIFVVPWLAYAAGVTGEWLGALFIAWTICALLILARLPHN